MNLKIYNKIYNLRDDCPEQVVLELKKRKDEICSEIYFKYINFWPDMKKFVVGYCFECGDYCRNRTDKIKNRKYSSDKILCKSCLSKECGKHSEFLKNNSNAQLIAQNKPLMKKKMSESLKNAWKNEEVAKRWKEGISSSAKSEEGRKRISISSKKLWQDDNYRNKMLNTFIGFRGVSGIFHSKFSGDIRFDSTYEFFYLFHQDLNRIKIERFSKEIKYILNNEIHGYIPDFIDDKKNIIEIKSSYIKSLNGFEELKQKRNSALDFIKNNDMNDYYLLEERDLQLLEGFEDRYKIIFLMMNDEHISIYRGKTRSFKIIEEEIKELYNKWSSLK